MQKIIDYLTVFSFYIKNHDYNVKQFIHEGWQPIGGICIDEKGNCIQSMVKYTIEENKISHFKDGGTCLL